MATRTSRTELALDDTFSSAVRLRICAYLSGCEEADFKAVQEFCDLSQSNLSKNLTALAERDYVEIRKVASGRYTKTRLRLTSVGQSALDAHIAALQEIISTARSRQLRRDDESPEERMDIDITVESPFHDPHDRP